MVTTHDQTFKLYLTIFRHANRIPDDTLIELALALALNELCSLRDDCDDPWECPLRQICPRGAKVRRWGALAAGRHIIGGDDDECGTCKRSTPPVDRADRL